MGAVLPVLQEHPLAPETVSGAIWRYSPEHPKLFHLHGQLELLLVIRGRATERLGNRTYRVHAGQLLWTLPGVSHEHIDGSSDLDMRIIHLEADLVPELASLCRCLAGRPLVELSRHDFLALLEDCDECSIEHSGFINRLSHLPQLACTAMRATMRDHDSRSTVSLAELACQLLREDPARDRTELCSLLDISGAHLSRCFSAELGTTIQEQRARLRVLAFLQHATRNGHNLLRSASFAGFGSYSQCSRVFGRLVGMTPRAYLYGNGRNLQALRPR